MTEPVPRSAEMAPAHADKSSGTSRRSKLFETCLDADGISLAFGSTDRGETNKPVRMHLHYVLFAHVLDEVAKAVSTNVPRDAAHRAALLEAATALCHALGADAGRSGKKAPARRRQDGSSCRLSPEEEEVLLLHVLE
jgi:hypothetical protein